MQTSIIKHSETISIGRLDAEFFHPEYISIINNIYNQNYSLLKNLCSSLIHPNEIVRAYSDSNDVRFLRAQNIRPMMLEFDNSPVYICKEQAEKLPRNKLQYKDILITRSGANFGQCGIYTGNDYILTSSEGLLLRTNNPLISCYLMTFLNTTYGVNLIERGGYGAAQPHIAPSYLKNIPIPLFSEKFQKNIEDMVLKAHAQRENANTLTKEAQTLLEKELGIYEWTPPKQALNISIKKHSETTHANRIDAEYYQPKYDAILEKITSYKGGYKAIHEICTLNKDTFKIAKDTEYQYVEIGSISVGNGDITSSPLLGANLPANCKRVLYKDDILVSKVRPYRGAIAIIDKNDYVGSGAFTVLQVNKEINKETLYTFLRLPIILALSLKPSAGTSYPVIVDEDVYNTIIPILDKKIQDIIATKITTAHQSRQLAKQLLELAKSTVENAIEHGE